MVLALSLQPGREHEIIPAVTYAIVILAILAQVLTLKGLVRRLVKR